MPRRKARRADWGCIQKVRPGAWRIRYWASTDERGYMRHSKTVYGTRKDAGDELARLRVEHSQDAPCPTVGRLWAEHYVPDLERRLDGGDIAPQTVETYRSAWRAHIAPRWADTPADEVRPLAVQQWIYTLSLSAAKIACAVMGQVLDYAVRYEMIATNPMRAKYVMPSKSTTATQDDGVWSPDQLLDVWGSVAGSPLEPVVLLCGFGGCRVGEALAVEGADVTLRDVDGVPVACVTIDKQVDGRGRVARRVKNRWSRRTVVLAGKPALRVNALARDGGYLADDGTGKPMSQPTARDNFKRLLDMNRVPHHPLRNLRKTWQTIARWTLRMPPWLTERMMGHVGEGVTGAHYDRPEADEFAAAIASAWKAHGFVD